MKPIFIFPGTFSPPTYGHLDIVNQISHLASKVYIICADNEKKKDSWFDPEECRSLWSSYRLPKNCEIYTMQGFMESGIPPHLKRDLDNVILVRGIRNENDYDYEAEVIEECWQSHGIRNFMIIRSKTHMMHISSSNARIFAECFDIERLAGCVSPVILGRMLERTLNVDNIFLVVGKPGSGKTTLLKMLEELDPRNLHINVDLLHGCMKDVLDSNFHGKSLRQAIAEDEDQLVILVKSALLTQISIKLMEIPCGKKNIFIEMAYAFDEHKEAFRYFGSKVIYIWCNSNRSRVIQRGTPHLLPLIMKILGKRHTKNIAKRFRLDVTSFNTSGSLEDTHRLAEDINRMILSGTIS